MKFFVDNNLSRGLARGMKAFGEDVSDTEWLAHIRSRGWCLVTRDDRIRHRPAEWAALREHGVGAFFMGGKNLSACQLVQQLVRNWPRMKKLADKTNVPFAFRVPPSGKNVKPVQIK